MKKDVDFEFLFINDGSKDRTSEIAKRYERQYPTIVKAVDKENGGHGDAVNTGLEHATGLYFKVVDSDDWVYDNYFTPIENVLKEDNWDLVQYSQNYTDGKEEKKRVLPDFKSCEAKEIFEKALGTNLTVPSAAPTCSTRRAASRSSVCPAPSTMTSTAPTPQSATIRL